MVIGDLDVPCFAIPPDETDPPLIVDANTVLAPAITPECLEAVARWRAQIITPNSRVNHQNLRSSAPLDLQRQTTNCCPQKTAADRLSAKLLINPSRNEERYVPSSSTNAYRVRPARSSRFRAIAVSCTTDEKSNCHQSVLGATLECHPPRFLQTLSCGFDPHTSHQPLPRAAAYPAPVDGKDSRVNWTVSPDANRGRISVPAYLTVNGLPSRDSMVARTN